MGRRSFGSIRERSSGRFQVRYKGPDGAVHTAPLTYPTMRDAEAYLSVIEADIIRQSWRAPSSVTEQLSSYGERVIYQRQLKPQSRLAYLADWQNHVAPTLGKKRVGTVTPSDVRDWHAGLTKSLADRMAAIEWTSTGSRRDGAATVARCYRILRMVLNTAVDDGLLDSNPCKITGAGNYRKPTRPTLSVAEVEELASAVLPRYKVLVLILAWTGLRLGEACALRWRDIDFKALTLTVERAVYPVDRAYIFGDPKSEAGRRTVGISKSLADEIRESGPDVIDALVVSTRSNNVAYSAAQTNITRPRLHAALSHTKSLTLIYSTYRPELPTTRCARSQRRTNSRRLAYWTSTPSLVGSSGAPTSASSPECYQSPRACSAPSQGYSRQQSEPHWRISALDRRAWPSRGRAHNSGRSHG